MPEDATANDGLDSQRLEAAPQDILLLGLQRVATDMPQQNIAPHFIMM